MFESNYFVRPCINRLRIVVHISIIYQSQEENWMYFLNLIQNSQAVKKGAALRKAMVKKDVKSKVAAKKWL